MSGRTVVVAALVAVAFAAGLAVGGRTDGLEGFADGLFGSSEGELTEEVIETIDENYFEEVDTGELDRASVRAIVNELRRRYEDRFSHYFNPEAYERFQEAAAGRFSGVGLSVSQVARGLRVSNVFEDSPAKEAGIKVGDVIVAVRGRSIAGEDAELATSRIKGKPGTEVELTVLTPSTGERRTLEIERAQLEVPVVEGSIRRVDGEPVAYVRLLGFSSGAHAELRDELERLYERGAEGLVLDLRGNGGGLLTEAVLTSSVFVEDGVIVSTKGRTSGTETFEAEGDAIAEQPTVVLINGDTASAAEILAAALADAELAEIVGERSFGKGTFQQVIPLDNGGALDLTIGEYLTRNGDSLANVGIEPDVGAKDRAKTRQDEALQTALDELAGELRGN